MGVSILPMIDPSVIGLILFVLMLGMIALGNSVRKKVMGSEEGDTKGGVNALLGALFGLWSFLLAFTFSQSSSRFDTVRTMIVDEANILRTTIIRADLFPDTARKVYRGELQKYLEERISYYDDASDTEKFEKNRGELSKTAAALWATTVALSADPKTHDAATGMATALTNLYDIGIKREALLGSGIPTPVTFLLISLALAICFVAGYTTPLMTRNEWLLIAVFSFLASTVLYIAIDLARPMQGLIKPDAGQITIVKLRNLFN
jgi:hypothetical protein